MTPDATIGNLLHSINTIFFVYWMLWIVVTPFVDASHFTQCLFPPREYGIAIPVLLVSVLVIVAVTVSSFHMIRQTGLTDDIKQARRALILAGDGASAFQRRNVFPSAPVLRGVSLPSPRGARLSSPEVSPRE